MLVMLIDFIAHPIGFVKGFIWSYKHFDRHGNRRDGSL